jgi:Bacterial membrane protein YfhO
VKVQRKQAPTPASAAAPDRSTNPGTKPRAFRDWHALTFLVLAIAFFFRDILLGKAFLWEDFLLQSYPFRHFAAVSLARGEMPLWNPYAFAGMPFQADIQSAVFYVPNLLLTAFTRGGTLSFYALEVMLIAHYAIAATGMFVLARDGGLARIYATFAGLVYALSGFMIVHAIHPGFVEQAAWLPWIMLCLHRSIERRSIRYALVTGVLAGHAILAGAPQLSLFVFLLMFSYSAAAVVVSARRTGLASSLAAAWLPALAVAVALGVASIQLLPTMELAPLSERDALSFDAAQAGRLAWQQLITAVMPKFFGVQNALENTYWGPGIYGTYWETCFYCGIPAFFTSAFAVSLVRRSARARFLVGVVVFSFMFAVGDQFILHRFFFAAVPGFSAFRAPARILLLATFAFSLLSAMGLRVVVDRAALTPRVVERALIGTLIAMLAVWAAVRFGAFLPDEDDPRIVSAKAIANRETGIALALSGIACGLGLLLTRRLAPPAVVVGAVLLLQLGDMARFGQDQNTGLRDAESYYHGRPEIRDLIGQLHQAQMAQLFRITSRDGNITMFDRNLGMVDRLYLTEGYTPLRLRRRLPPAATYERTLDLLNSKYRVTGDTVARNVRMSTSTTYVPHAMVVPGYTVIADDSAAARFLRRPDFDPLHTVVLSEPLSSPLAEDTARAKVPEVSIVLLDYRANSLGLKLDSPRAGILLLSEIYYPGWHALVDGAEQHIYRADWNLRAIPITAGVHTISMRFAPRSFRIGAWITVTTLLLAVVGWIVSGGMPLTKGAIERAPVFGDEQRSSRS